MSSNTNVFFFEVPTPNGQCLAVYRTFAVQTNAVHCSLATHSHQHFSHFRMSHSAFAYRCGRGLRVIERTKSVQCAFPRPNIFSMFFLQWNFYVCVHPRASITTHQQGWQRSDKILLPVTSELQSWVMSLLCRQRSKNIIKVTKIFHTCVVYTILPFVTYRS